MRDSPTQNISPTISVVSLSNLISLSRSPCDLRLGKMATAVAKKASAPKKSKAPSHPPYIEMVKEALVALKERTGSSHHAIAKHIEEQQKVALPPNFKKMLSVQLKKSVASGKLVKVKNSFKIAPVEKKPAAAKAKEVTEKKPKKTVVSKEKPKKAAPAKAKGKTVTKPKAVVAKPKAVAKSPAKKAAATKAVKKAVEMKAKKPKSIKSPVKKKAAATKKARK